MNRIIQFANAHNESSYNQQHLLLKKKKEIGNSTTLFGRRNGQS
jgi:hypothetical protein